MPWRSNSVPDAAKNLSKPQKKKFAEVANAILEEEKKKGTPIKEAEGKAIRIALAQVKKESEITKEITEEKRYIEAVVYSSNLYKLSDGLEYTVCESCGEANEVSKSTGYCIECEEPLGDFQGDVATADVVEQMMFSYMENINNKIQKQNDLIKKLVLNEEVDLTEYMDVFKHHIGEGHTEFGLDNGHLVSSYLKKETIEIKGEEVEKASWIQGTIVSPEIYQKVKEGKYNSYSFGGKAFRIELNS